MHKLSLVVVSKVYSVAVCGLLTAAASLIVEPELLGMGASLAAAYGLSSCGTWA